MLVLCLIWSLQQIVLKATVDDFSPVLQIALRSGAASLLVGLYMWARGERMSLSKSVWQPGLLTGSLFALEYLFVGQGLRLTSASHIVVFLYTAPIFAALGLQWKLPSERLAPLQWLGILLAFAGIVAAFLLRGANVGNEPTQVMGDFLGLLGGIAWGATTVVIRTTGLADLPAAETLLYQLTGAFFLLLPAALLMGQNE
jgi:drug/metabolite transporter (DMT)-like permease